MRITKVFMFQSVNYCYNKYCKKSESDMFALIKCRYFKISSVLDVIAALALIVTIKYAKLSPSLKYSLCGIAMAQGSLASFFTVKKFFFQFLSLSQCFSRDFGKRGTGQRHKRRSCYCQFF